jgi:hypothetical protein
MPINYSKSHNGSKIQENIETKDLARSPHPSYFPDLSPCAFWVFGTAKGKIKDREFHTIQEFLSYLTEFWNDLTFEDVQSAFLEWKIRLN